MNIEDHISLVIYRVIQEALTNIARHSGATTTDVKIRLSKNKIDIVITDNGKGIETKQILSPNSLGLAGIQERVKSVRGRVKFKGSKKSGTSISVSIPINISGND
jgi:two-component system sensor histidine kinase UhpB